MNEWLNVWSDAMQRTLPPLTIAVAVLWFIEAATTWLTPKFRSWLWRLVFIKCLFVFCMPFGLPLPSIAANLIDFNAVAVAEIVPPSRTTHDFGNSVPITNAPLQAASVLAVASPQDTTVTTSTIPVGVNVTLCLFLLWIIGIFVQCIRLVHHHAALRSQLHRGKVSDIPRSLRAIYRQTALAMGVHRPPVLQLNDRFTSPALVWNGRFLLVLPSDFELRHGNEACRAAIAHELAHFRRSDLLWNAMVTLVGILLFFFPPLWIACRRYRMAMESACDWDAIGYSRVDLATYARLLVNLLEPHPRKSPSLAAVSMSGSESFRSLSERLQTMKRFNGFSRRTRLIHASVTLMMLCILIPWTHADDENNKSDRYSNNKENTNTSSANSSSSSSSQSVNGITRSNSSAKGSATGNASGGADANGAAGSLEMQNGQQPKSSSANSSARIRVRGQAKSNDHDPNADKRTTTDTQSASTSNIQVNGIQISRSMRDENGTKLAKMDVIDKTQEISCRESSEDGIEVRVRDRDKNSDGSFNEKVYTVATWDELKQQAPELVKKIKRYEKMAVASTTVADVDGGTSLRIDINEEHFDAINATKLDAKQMMKAQLHHMLQQHADNPEMQRMIRKTLESLDK